jgi:hypothetical protein
MARTRIEPTTQEFLEKIAITGAFTRYFSKELLFFLGNDRRANILQVKSFGFRFSPI